MIEPVKSGAALLDEMDVTSLSDDQFAVWWLGQSGFVFKWHGALIVIDPYLSEHLTAKYVNTERPHVRMTRAPFRGSEMRRACLLLSTHKHSDHLDPGTIPDLMRAVPSVRLALPRPLIDHARSMGLDNTRLVAADAGKPLRFHVGRGPDVVVYPVPSAHESLDYTEEAGYPYLGYVIQFGGRAIYHPGDCVPYPGLEERLREFPIEVAFLPINGRDPQRGVAGNFMIAEAASLAEAVGARWLVPMHYDMFTFNTVPVADFVAHMQANHPTQKYKILQPGERWIPAPPA